MIKKFYIIYNNTNFYELKREDVPYDVTITDTTVIQIKKIISKKNQKEWICCAFGFEMTDENTLKDSNFYLTKFFDPEEFDSKEYTLGSKWTINVEKHDQWIDIETKKEV